MASLDSQAREAIFEEFGTSVGALFPGFISRVVEV